MSNATKPTIEEMAAHIVSEVQYDMRHGKPVSSSCDYAERRIKELVADARAAGFAEAKAIAEHAAKHEAGRAGEAMSIYGTLSGVPCPHCGHKQDGECGSEVEYEHDCDECGKTFAVSASFDVYPCDPTPYTP